MPVQSRQNQFLGINPHFNSYLQAKGRWSLLHGVFNTYITQHLNDQLLSMNYVAEYEKSLQVRRLGESSSQRVPDVLIRDRNLDRFYNASPTRLQTKAIPLGLLDDELEDEDQYSAVGIYDRDSDHTLVAWIEFLSPSNKGKTPDAIAYVAKRKMLLEQGIVIVEIDFLHETPPTLINIADYSIGEKDSHPYRIMVIDPRNAHEYRDFQVYLHEFDVDTEPVPSQIPLLDDDIVLLDVNAIYQQAYWLIHYGLIYVDYATFPVNFHTYSTDDQARIATRMLYVLEAPQENLDHLPALLATLPLEEAMRRLAVIGIVRNP